jgi:LysR family transcriptional regulator, hypochlorite-specific transcription factor HypT
MELKWLEDFVCLAGTGSFWKASQERHVSQPAFSRRIRALENWIGVTLVDRSSSPISLTPGGLQFLSYAQEMIRTSRSVREEFRLLAAAAENEIRIATLHTLAIYLLPSRIAALMAKRPDAKAVVIPSVQGIEQHFDALANGIVDVLLIYGDETIGMNSAYAVEEKVVGEDEYVPVVSPAFARRYGVTDLREDSGELPFLAYSDFSFSEKLVAPAVRSLGKRLRVVYENSLGESLKAMALQDCGVAWLPRSTAAAELKRGELLCIGDAELLVQVKIKAFRLPSRRSDAVNAMWHLL